MDFSFGSFAAVIAASLSATVAVALVLIKPIVEEWYEFRRKRILFECDRAFIARAPINSVKLKVGDFIVDQLSSQRAVIHNLTGRTHRDLNFTITITPGRPDDGFLIVGISDSFEGCRVEEFEKNKWLVQVEEFPRRQSINLVITATEEQVAVLSTKSDFEVVNRINGRNVKVKRFTSLVSLIKNALLGGAIAVGILAAAGWIAQ